MNLFLDSWQEIHLIYWLYLIMSIMLCFGVLIYIRREWIKEKYLKIRFPEKVIKIVIHYPGTQWFSVFWRLIPDKPNFILAGKTYLFDDETIIKQNDFYAIKKDDSFKVKVDGITYDLNTNFKVRKRGQPYPELHYIWNVPEPLDFKLSTEQIEMASTQLDKFINNDLFTKLLTMQGEKSMIMFLMILGAVNLLGTLFVISKLMGWLK